MLFYISYGDVSTSLLLANLNEYEINVKRNIYLMKYTVIRNNLVNSEMGSV